MNFRKMSVLVGVLIIGCIVSPALAQEPVQERPVLEPGVHEATGLAMYVEPEDADMGIFILTVMDRYFYTGNVQLGGAFMFAGTVGADDDAGVNMFMGNATYNFNLENSPQYVPYAYASLGYASVEFEGDSEGGMLYGAGAGIRYFLNRSTAIILDASHQIIEMEGESMGTTMVLGGLSFFLMP